MARIYQFPDLNPEGYPVFNAEDMDNEIPYSEEEINRQYEEYYQWERDEYIFNQLLKQEQDQNKQRKRQICPLQRFAQRLISIFS